MADVDQRGRPVAIITGSSSGIGHACAVDLARTGWDVVLHGLGTGDEDLPAAVAEVEALGASAVAVPGDVRDPDVVQALVSAAAQQFGRLDGVVSNAGSGLTRTFVDLTDDDWATLLETHLRAAVRLLRYAFPLLCTAGGAAVLTSSVAGRLGLPGRTGYGATKSALEGLARQLGCEWAGHGIRVNCVAPGTVRTPLVRRNLALGHLDEEAVLQRTPLGRFAEPSEVATVVRFLLSHDSSYMTGQTLHVDGGWSAWGGWS